jgi:monooxygenase
MAGIRTSRTIVTSASKYDVVIIGAGLSGICAAYHLQKRCSNKRYRIIEARSAISGTWYLFRYPGIRSDSDMFSFGFSFKPWTNDKVIEPGETILEYLREAAAKNGIDQRISFGHKVLALDWDSSSSRWTVQIEESATGKSETLSCQFVFARSGYYRYENGYTPDFPGINDFAGQVVHPQHWPQDMDCSGKRLTVIGSGATAMTLAPNLAKAGAKVTLLQRSPTWIIARSAQDKHAARLRKLLPAKAAHGVNRWRHILQQMLFYQMSKRRPENVKRFLISQLKRRVGDKVDVKKHFILNYNPWTQRVCLVPRADFFRAVRDESITMATDHIEVFTKEGITLKSGETIESDIVITATGLVVQPLGGVALTVDGREINSAEHYNA